MIGPEFGTVSRPDLKTARMIREHLWGIVNAVILRATNGPAEGINSRIKTHREFCPRAPTGGHSSPSHFPRAATRSGCPPILSRTDHVPPHDRP